MPGTSTPRPLSEDLVNRSARRSLPVFFFFFLFSLPVHPPPPAAPNPFAENVRPTAALTPEQELKSFHLPPGFTIQLVASEPEIHKPINIALDAKGRLWATSTVEYPLPVRDPNVKPRDEVKIIEIDPTTGHATKVTTFADGLNIPTGVYPYKNGAIAFSIPNIYYLKDTDGDGVADKRDEHYGRPHDGIGFYPHIMGHLHGSTAIGGVVTIDDSRWPEAFQSNLICGNPVTSRVDRDSLEWHGSTPTANEQADFVASDDPWFRPVAFAFSPDGSIYVADFYNKVIGHYEVPLTHPGRDRTSGRILRIVPPLAKTAGDADDIKDFSTASPAKLVKALGHPNISGRMVAIEQLTDHIGK